MRTIQILICLILISTPSSLLAGKVRTDYDKDVDFSQYRTYQWKAGNSVESELAHQRIVAALENQLAIEGIRKVDADSDLLVVYHASLKQDFDIRDTGYGRPRWGYGREIHLDKYLVGTLVVDFVDARSGKLVWRGVATGKVSDKPEKNEKKIAKAVEKLFKKYPPEKD